MRLDPPVAVEVLADGREGPGLATAHQGRRVSVRWTQAPGEQYLAWKVAEYIRRT